MEWQDFTHKIAQSNGKYDRTLRYNSVIPTKKAPTGWSGLIVLL